MLAICLRSRLTYPLINLTAVAMSWIVASYDLILLEHGRIDVNEYLPCSRRRLKSSMNRRPCACLFAAALGSTRWCALPWRMGSHLFSTAAACDRLFVAAFESEMKRWKRVFFVTVVVAVSGHDGRVKAPSWSSSMLPMRWVVKWSRGWSRSWADWKRMISIAVVTARWCKLENLLDWFWFEPVKGENWNATTTVACRTLTALTCEE